MSGERKRPNRKLVISACVLVVLIALCGLAGFVTGIGPYDLPAKSRALDETIATSKKLGLPMTQADLVGVAPATEDNAAPGVIKAAGTLRDPTTSFDALNKPAGDSERASLIAELTITEPHVESAISELESKPAWFVSRDWDMGPDILFPEFADIKTLSKHLAVRNTVLAQDGDIRESLRGFRAARELSRRVCQEPTLIGILVAIACNSITLREVERIASAFQSDPIALGLIEQALVETRHVIDPTPPVRGEFYFCLSMTRNLMLRGGLRALEGSYHEDYSPPSPRDLQRTGLPIGMLERASLTTLADGWNKVYAHIKSTESPHYGWGKILDDRVRAMEKDFRASTILALILFPVLNQAETALLGDVANQDLAIAYVRCLKFKAKNKRWPRDLKEANAEFDDHLSPGKKIQARFSPTEMRLWAVGRDRIDDGGKIRSLGEGGDDMVYVWPPKSRKR